MPVGPPQLQQPKVSLDVAKCPLGDRTVHGWESLPIRFHSCEPSGEKKIASCWELLSPYDPLHSVLPTWFIQQYLLSSYNLPGTAWGAGTQEWQVGVNCVCVQTNAYVSICTRMFFFLSWWSECYFKHFFLYRFGTDVQMINFTTSEFQLTKACPYRVGCHL